MKKTGLLVLLFALNAISVSAQKKMTVSGEYTYYAPTTVTLDMAKATALDRAKIELIADNFGTVIGVSNTTRISNENGESSTSFLSLSESEVKGEWIETIGEPEYQIGFEQGMLIVRVSVRGVIREIKAAKIPFEARILRNGTEDKFESDVFREGDELFVSFETPQDGYLTIYLYDQSGVNRLLPLLGDKEGSQFVESGERKVFFAQKGSRILTSEYVMTCSADNEMNRLYFIFSPNKYYRANDSQEESTLPASLSFENFQKWLAKTRRQDVDMSLKIKDITIRK